MRPGDHRRGVRPGAGDGLTPLARSLPIVLFIDRGFPVSPFAEALAGELECREEVTDDEGGRVVGLVTGIEPVGATEVAPFPELRLVLTCSTGTDTTAPSR